MDANELFGAIGSAVEMKDRVYGYLLATRGNKYKKWIRGIKILKRLALWAERWLVPLGLEYFRDARERLDMLEAVYTGLRPADDITDGDAELPGNIPADMYIVRLIVFVKTGGMPRDLVERLMAHAFYTGDKLGMNMREPVLKVLRSLLFDAKRRDSSTLQICDADEMEKNYDLCDIEGVVIGCLIAARESLEEWERIAPLARAVRIGYNIEDLDAEMSKNLCNISREDVEKFNIFDPRDTHSHEVRKWKFTEAARGLILLERYRWGIRTSTLHPITRLILWLAFERPTEKSLDRILLGNFD